MSKIPPSKIIAKNPNINNPKMLGIFKQKRNNYRYVVGGKKHCAR